MTSFVIAVLLPGFLLTWLAGLIVRRVAPRIGLVDRPGHRKVHAAPVALGGGLTIWLGLVLPLTLGLIWVWLGAPLPWSTSLHPQSWLNQLVLPHLGGVKQQTPDVLFLLGCATVLMLLGLADDYRGLNWQIRLLVQAAVAVAVVFGKGWKLTVFVDLPTVTNLLSVLWIVGLINSFNMLDNMDGLSAGVAAIASAILAAVLLIAPDPENQAPQLFVAGLLLLLVGALGGFLWHNRPPARLFMGDAGSYLIGFLIAVLTMLATFTGGTLPRHAILAPLCVLAVPLYDTLSVVWIRLRSGRSPFEGDKNHFSHRLVDLGLSKTQAVLTIYLTTAACGLCAVVLHQVDSLGALVLAISIACLLAVIAILETTARRQVNKRANSSREMRKPRP